MSILIKWTFNVKFPWKRVLLRVGTVQRTYCQWCKTVFPVFNCLTTFETFHLILRSEHTKPDGKRQHLLLTNTWFWELWAFVQEPSFLPIPFTRIISKRKEGWTVVLFHRSSFDWKSRESQEIKGSLSKTVRKNSISCPEQRIRTGCFTNQRIVVLTRRLV